LASACAISAVTGATIALTLAVPAAIAVTAPIAVALAVPASVAVSTAVAITAAVLGKRFGDRQVNGAALPGEVDR